MRKLEIKGPINGQVAMGDINIEHVYMGGWEAFARKSLDELRGDLELIRPSLEATRRAFIRHRSVPFFVGAICVLGGVVATAPIIKPWLIALPRPLGVLFFAALLAAVSISAIWMDRSRKNIFNGLKLLRAYEERIKSLIAIREAEKTSGISH